MWYAIFADGIEHETGVDDQSDEGSREAVRDTDTWLRDCDECEQHYSLVWRDD